MHAGAVALALLAAAAESAAFQTSGLLAIRSPGAFSLSKFQSCSKTLGTPVQDTNYLDLSPTHIYTLYKSTHNALSPCSTHPLPFLFVFSRSHARALALFVSLNRTLLYLLRSRGIHTIPDPSTQHKCALAGTCFSKSQLTEKCTV